MKTFIFEGPVVSISRPVMVTHRFHDQSGKEIEVHELRKASPALLGWRHYQVRWGNRSRTFVSQPSRVHGIVEQLRATFYEAGTWEDESVKPSYGVFPVPRGAILDELRGIPQTEFAL